MEVPAACLGSAAGRQFEVVIELHVVEPLELLGAVGRIVLGVVQSDALVFVGLVADVQMAAQLGPLLVVVT